MLQALSSCKKGQSSVIVRIDADSALKERLMSFGLVRGEVVTIKGCSAGKKTIEIEVEGTLIALRNEEAQKILVEPIE